MVTGLVGCAGLEDPSERTTFVQADHDQVDLLWVVDDSSAFMETVQRRLADAVPVIVEPLRRLDVRMAVLPTTVGASLDPVSFRGDEADLDWLADRLQVGADGSDREQGLQVALQALDPARGFVRTEGHLVVVFVSDEDDCSDQGKLAGTLGSACYTAANRLEPVVTYLAAYDALHDGALNRTTVVSIGAGAGSSCPLGLPQDRYAEVAEATGGPLLDLCATDQTENLRTIARHAAGQRQVWRLPEPAYAPSLRVTVDATPVDDVAYEPEGWQVRFFQPHVPEPGAVIELSYEIDSWFSPPTP
ncbi:MAG: hypothetical protein AAF211_17655 [Myxococcota bacterium]